LDEDGSCEYEPAAGLATVVKEREVVDGHDVLDAQEVVQARAVVKAQDVSEARIHPGLGTSLRTGRCRIAASCLGLLVFAAIPLQFHSLLLGNITTGIALCVALLGVNLMAGFVGRVALGHGAFVGTGAYTAAILAADHQWPLVATIPAAGAIGFLIGAFIAMPALRIRGLHLALVSLACGAAFGPVVKRFETVTNGANGKSSNASWVSPTWLGEGRDPNARWSYIVVLLIATVVFLGVANLTRGRIGRSLVALRDNDLAARACGVPVDRYTVAMFGVSAGVAAIAGALLVIKEPFVSYESFETAFSLQLFAAATVGGIASVWGAPVGAATLVAAPFLVRRLGIQIDSNALFGALLILAVILVPNGVAGQAKRLRSIAHRQRS
jgi:branched-chain amino acid transport system permease protein